MKQILRILLFAISFFYTGNLWLCHDAQAAEHLITPAQEEYDEILRLREEILLSSGYRLPEPQENGQVYAYDKVTNPIEVGVSVLFHGDFALQQEALSAIEAARSGTELFTIVTPARVYSRMALISYSITRSSTNGANSLSVDCRFQEIRNATIRSQTAVWSPKNPTSSDVVNTGQKSLLGDMFGSYSVSNVPGQNGG